jgi:hypothetical protein
MDDVDRLIIDFDIWFKKWILGYDDSKNLLVTLKALSGSDTERTAYIRSRFSRAYHFA